MKTSTVSLDILRRNAPRGLSLFVCSASFEDRCISVPQAIQDADACILAYNEDYYSVSSENFDKLKRLFSRTTVCNMRTDDPLQTADEIVRSVDCTWPAQSATQALQVGIDITTFTRESLLILIKYVWSKIKAGDQLTLYYNLAQEYSVGVEDSDKWLSSGIREVRSVLGYPGKFLPSRQNHLIVMTGFEDVRALRLVSEWEPSMLSLGVADSADEHTTMHQRINEERRRRVQNIFGPVRYFAFSGYDPLRARIALEEQISVGGDMNTLIAPMNTKIATIGAGLVGWRNPDVQLCYAQAEVYNYRGYSTPGDTVYVITMRKEDIVSLDADV